MRHNNDEYNYYPPKDSFTKQEIPVFVPIILICFGLIFIILGVLIEKIPEIAYKNCTEEVSAVVTDNVKKDDTYAPEFTFEYQGKEYSVISNASTNPPMFNEGDEVTLLIDPDNPNRIHPPIDNMFSIMKIVFSVIGAVPVIMAVALFVYSVIRTSEKGSEYT